MHQLILETLYINFHYKICIYDYLYSELQVFIMEILLIYIYKYILGNSEMIQIKLTYQA